MKRYLKFFTALLVCATINQSALYASSHREAPLISSDPLADNTDVYAFRSPSDSSKVVLIANYIPFEHPAGGPNYYTFGDNIRYEIHVKNSATTTGDDITYRFTFHTIIQDSSTFFNIRLGAQNQKTTYILEKSVAGAGFVTIISNGIVPPNNIGPRSIEGGVGLSTPYDTLMNRAITMANNNGAGEKVFAGPIDDPFFVDLGGAFDVGGFRKTGRDGLAKFNCHSLVIEVPISSLQKSGRTTAMATSILDPEFVIGVYASASRPSISTFDSTGGPSGVGGTWVQVSRLGMPLTNEAVMPIGVKDLWNSSSPYASTEISSFASYFQNPELALYMDDSQFGGAVPGLADLRIQKKSLGSFDFRNGQPGLYALKGNPALVGTALDPATFGNILLPDNHSPRAVDILPIFYTGVPNLIPYQLATGKAGNPLAGGKPFINNFLPTLGDLLRLNMAVPVTPRNSPDFSSLGIVSAAVLGLTDARFTASGTALQNIPNMDGFPNGRRLEDDVTTIELQAVSGVALAAIGLWYDDYIPGTTASPVTPQLVKVLSFNAGVTKNDTTFKSVFPYVQGPWRGFTGASYAGPVNPITSYAAPTKFMTGVTTNIAIARPGYNKYNGEPISMYNVDTTTGKANIIAGAPLRLPYSSTVNIDVNGAGINAMDSFAYAIYDTSTMLSSAATSALLFRIGANYSNYPVGMLPTPSVSAGQTAVVNPAAGTFDDAGNYYYTVAVGTGAGASFAVSNYYLGKIANVASLTQGVAALTATFTAINLSAAACTDFGLQSTLSTASTSGALIQDITYSRLYKSIYFYTSFVSQMAPNANMRVGELFGINPLTGVTTCYPAVMGIGASNNEVSGISTTTNGSLLVFLTGGDIYKTNVAPTDGAYTGVLTKLGASGIPALGVTGSIRGDLASMGFGASTLPASRPSVVVSPGLVLTDGITAYPNPALGFTTVTVVQPLVNANVRLLTLTGNVISERSGVNGTTFGMNMTGNPSGLYMIEIIQGGSIQKIKVMKF